MTSAQECPACGETEALHGAPVDDGIEITCQTCAHRWPRGDLRCHSCRGAETVVIPQVLARTSRGSQLSITGHRDIVLCPVCDAEVIARCQTARQWVPEDYVSVFSYDAAEAERVRREPKPADVEQTPSASGQASRPVQQRPAEPMPDPAPQSAPTVRQAIAEYMAAEPQADALAMLSLGTFLGSATRVDTLAGEQAAASLQSWFVQTWGSHDAHRRAVVGASVQGAFAHWVAREWIADDPSVDLAP